MGTAAWRQVAAAVVILLSFGTPAVGGLPKPTLLHFSLVDQLPFEAGTTGVNRLDERRRLTVFAAALHAAVQAGKFPPSELINRNTTLRVGLDSEKPQPPGTRIIRLYLTQWSQTPLGGATNSEVLCRFFAEEVRDGRRTANLGPCFGRVRADEALIPLHQDQFALYQEAALRALDQLAAKLPR